MRNPLKERYLWRKKQDRSDVSLNSVGKYSDWRVIRMWHAFSDRLTTGIDFPSRFNMRLPTGQASVMFDALSNHIWTGTLPSGTKTKTARGNFRKTLIEWNSPSSIHFYRFRDVFSVRTRDTIGRLRGNSRCSRCVVLLPDQIAFLISSQQLPSLKLTNDSSLSLISIPRYLYRLLAQSDEGYLRNNVSAKPRVERN